jgi:hypothetical protein
MARQYHVSVNFADSDYTYHTTFDSHSTNDEAIIQAGRVAITKKLEAWKLEAKNIKSVEIYYFTQTKETIIYKFEKQ